MQSIGNKKWEYVVEFVPRPDILKRRNVRMIFEGLDTLAEVYLNGRLLFRADNMFRRWSVDCSGIIQRGANTLRVLFLPTAGDPAKGRRLELPGGDRVHIRKAAYQFGWDWAPRMLSCGIWRPVRLIGWDRGRISGVKIIRKGANDDEAHLTARVELEISERGEYLLDAFDGKAGSLYGSASGRFEPGEGRADLDIRIENPKLWWTNGLGEPHLYDI
jgi:beta-mannosidase